MLSIDNNLNLFSYFEAFHNFDNDIVERFFTQNKNKSGFGYRINYSWRTDIGLIYRESKNNAVEQGQVPANIITNYNIEWGIAYVIPLK